MKKTSNRRNFLNAGVTAGGIAAAAAVAPEANAKAKDTPTKRVIYKDGKPPEKTPMFSSTVAYGNLLFIAGVGAHFPGDIKAHTKHVLDQIEQQLTAAGSSMEKCLKCNVYLANAKDFAEMNEVFLGRWGKEPPVRTTIAAAWVPGDSLVEIDVIAYI